MKKAGTAGLTFVGLVVAAMVAIAGLALLAYVVLIALAMNNFGSNK
jgi:hypothetical protein